MAFQYNQLKPDRIVETQRKLRDRIRKRFPDAGLAGVADELLTVSDQAIQRSEAIRRPILSLRIGIALIHLIGIYIAARLLLDVHVEEDLTVASTLLTFCESALAVIVFLGAAVIFLVSLEKRWKRSRALNALHELRAFAHVVDMHQVSKDPEGLLQRGQKLSTNPNQTTRTLYDLNRYLSYCNELLAIISKIAALYVQDFPDGPSVSAVDQVENLCSGLSRKIWQKLMILDEMLDEQSEEQEKK